ncbi:MAG: MFS transporter [Fibrobacteria bacterium]|nr:MFS transporter [Fibrobacteria bacterium]
MKAAAMPIAGRVALFCVLAFLLQAGFSLGWTAMNALFLSTAGSSALGLVYLATPVAMSLAVGASTWFLDRWGTRGQLLSSIGGSFLVALALWSIYSSDPSSQPLAVHVAAMLGTNIWLFLLYSSFWNFSDGFFDTREARTAYPYLGAGISGGFAVGSFAASWLSRHVDVHEIFLGWSLFLVFALPLALWIPSRLPMLVQVADPREEGGFRVRMFRLWKTFLQSPYAIALAVLFFLVIVLALFSEYLYLSQFERTLRQVEEGGIEARLAHLNGTLAAVASLLNLVANLVVLPRLVNRLGIRNIAFLLPLTYLALFSLVSVEMNFPLAIALFMAYQFLQTSIDQGNQNLLLRALPEKVGKELRTVVEGASEPLAVALVGLLILPEMEWIRAVLPLEPMLDTDIGLLGALFAVGAVVAAVVVRKAYREALRLNLAGRPPDAERPGSAEMSGTNLPRIVPHPETIQRIECRCLREGPSRDLLDDIDFPSLSGEEIHRLLLLAPWYDTAVLARWEHLSRRTSLATTPALSRVLLDPTSSVGSRLLAARSLNRVAPVLFEDLLPQLERSLLQGLLESWGLAASPGADGWQGLLLHTRRQAVADRLDLLLELVALSGRIPEFRSVRRLLRSFSAFDRGHALDVIEQGFPRKTFRLLAPCIEWQFSVPGAIEGPPHPREPTAIDAFLRLPRSADPVETLVRMGSLALLDRPLALRESDWYLAHERPLPLRRMVHDLLFEDGLSPLENVVFLLSDPGIHAIGLRNAFLLSSLAHDRPGWKGVADRNASLARALLEAGWRP